MKIAKQIVLIAATTMLAEAHNHHHHHHDHHHHKHHHFRHGREHERNFLSKKFLSRTVGDLEKNFIEDCQRDASPHGFYGAVLEPCEFAFFTQENDLPVLPSSSSNVQETTASPCQGIPLATPTPLNWVLNLTEHYTQDDWDSISWDSMSSDDIKEKIMLWPDQCVAVEPRCYSLNNHDIHDSLATLFDEIPIEATHVRVDCRVDALALSRTVYAVSEGMDKAIPWVFAFGVVCFTLFWVLFFLCCYGCCRVCFSKKATNVVALDGTTYVTMEKEGQEKTKLLD